MADRRYLFRLDDACPWQHRERWSKIEALFDRHGVKPIVAVVPQCQDPDLMVNPEDPQFWEVARGWQAKGWSIALHGFDHLLTGRGRGLVPLNDRTEFVGRPESEQRQKIRAGWEILRQHGLMPEVWVGPAHTFDRVTLRCLLEETPIRIVSDGLSSRPFRRFGLVWIPQQLWKPRLSPPGVWTICLHPNQMDDREFVAVESFLQNPELQFFTVNDVLSVHRSWGVSDWLFEVPFRILKQGKRWSRKFIGR